MDAAVGLRRVADLLRRNGFSVTEVPGWQTRGKGTLSVRALVNHWTAGSRRGGNTASLRICTFGRAGLRNALCNFYVARDGHIYLVAARTTWHAGRSAWRGLFGLNDDAIGIEAENDGLGEPWSDRSIEAQLAIARLSTDVFGFDLPMVADHFEVATPEGRKVDRHDVGGPAWRARLEAAQMRTPAQAIVVPTEQFDDKDRDWDRALGTVLADTYGLDLLETDDGIRFTSLIHGGPAKPTDWAGVVGAARYKVDVNPPGARIAGGTAEDTARVVAEFLQAHPKSSWRRRGRPF